MAAMRERSTWILCRAALGVSVLCALGCAANQNKRGFSIEATSGKRTGNPLEIHLIASDSLLKAVLVNRSSSEQKLLCGPRLQASTLELFSTTTGSRPKPYDSRKIGKFDATPYCHLFQTIEAGKKMLLAAVHFRKSRDGYSGAWGPFNFDELPPGDYQARVTWLSERSQCLDDGTGKMSRLPSIWRGVIQSNQVTLHLP
jgi:hypothetical protein